MLKLLPEPEDSRFWLTMARLNNGEDMRVFLKWLSEDVHEFRLQHFRSLSGAEGAEEFRVFLDLVTDLLVLFRQAHDRAMELEELTRRRKAEEENLQTAPSGDGARIV